MPVLSDATLLKLAGYEPTEYGIDIPGTTAGPKFEAVCWNWVVSACRLHTDDPNSPKEIIDGLLDYAWGDDHTDAVGVKAVNDANYPGSAQDIANLSNRLATARTPRDGMDVYTPDQFSFGMSLFKVVLRRNGIIPNNAPHGNYNVVIKSTDWYNSDHWAIGILLPTHRRMYVQTLGYEGVRHNGTTVRDDGLPEFVIGIDGLLQAHIDILDAIPKAPCRTCGQSHGRTRSILKYWHQCRRCGAIYCPNDGSALDGKLGTLDPSRRCGVPDCAGRTRLWEI